MRGSSAVGVYPNILWSVPWQESSNYSTQILLIPWIFFHIPK